MSWRAAAMKEILTEDEEAVLAIVSRSLELARAGGGVVDVRGLSAAISAVGARIIVETGARASFVHRSAHFSVRALAQAPGRFELSFQEADP